MFYFYSSNISQQISQISILYSDYVVLYFYILKIVILT